MRYRHRVLGGRIVVRSLFRPAGGEIWHCRLRDARTGRICVRTTREVDQERAERVALAIAEEWLRQLDARGTKGPRGTPDALSEWLAELDLAKTTRREYESMSGILSSNLPASVAAIDREAIKRFVRVRSGEVGARTVAKQVGLLRAFLRWCVAERWLEADPSIGIKLPSVRSREGIALTHAEAADLLRAATPVKKTVRDEKRGEWKQTFGAPHLRLFILIALHTGLRKSNILRLRWNQVDLRQRRIDIPAGEMKMRRRHVVPLHAELARALRQSLPRSPSDYVLGRERKDIRKAFQGALKKSTITHDLRIHDLRHTFSTWAQMRLPYLMAEWLCARRVKAVAGTYFHPSFEECLEAIDSLPWIENGPASARTDRSHGTAQKGASDAR